MATLVNSTTAQFANASLRGDTHGLFRYSPWDGLLVIGAIVHGILLLCFPSIILIAVCLWWNANSAAHYFVHLPFFNRGWQNRLFSAFLTLLLGVPQRLWRDRHLAHHANVPWKLRYSAQLAAESAIVAALWTGMILWDYQFFFRTYIPGWLLGLMLCHAHGYFEHYRGTVSYYGRLYNLALFNDGWHIEHHLKPGLHWRRLPNSQIGFGDESAWPAVLRFLELITPGWSRRSDWSLVNSTLGGLERLVSHYPKLQLWMLRTHKKALRRALAHIPEPHRIGVVGGGLFPRTPLILQELFPSAELWIIDASKPNLDYAQQWLGTNVFCVHCRFDQTAAAEFDLITIPLAYQGDRKALYAAPVAKITVLHDWVWRRRGLSVVVSWWLLKRINVLKR